MKITHTILFMICLLIGLSCSKRSEIIKLLNSNDKDDIIEGSFYAGESGRKEYISLLLKNAADHRGTTNLRYYGITVYQAKMIALRKIFKKNPPKEIGRIPDSTVISFYINLFGSVSN